MRRCVSVKDAHYLKKLISSLLESSIILRESFFPLRFPSVTPVVDISNPFHHVLCATGLCLGDKSVPRDARARCASRDRQPRFITSAKVRDFSRVSHQASLPTTLKGHPIRPVNQHEMHPSTSGH